MRWLGITLVVLLVVVVLVVARPVAGFKINYIEVAYVDKSFNVQVDQLREVAYNILSKFVDWDRVVYARLWLLNINGSPILYAKAFMVSQAPVTTTCTAITVTTTPVTVSRICKTITTTAPLNAGFTYYPTSNGMEAVYVKALLAVESGKVVGVKQVDYYKTVLGKEVWDPIALGKIIAGRVWESQAVLEAVTKAAIVEHLKPTELWLSSAEHVYPPEYIISVIFLSDNYIYGVIYDWDNHKIIAVGLDIIEPPYYIPGQEHSMPTTPIPATTIATIKTTTILTTTPTITTYTRTATSPSKLPLTTTTVTLNTITYTSASTGESAQTSPTSVWRTTTTTTPTMTTMQSGEVYELSVTTSQLAPRTLSTNSILIVVAATVIVALVSWLFIRRFLI